MRIIALILSILLAFPNIGHSMGNNCCSGDKMETMSCHGDAVDTDSNEDSCHDDDDKSCAGQCDCSCCQATVMATDSTKEVRTAVAQLVKSEALNLGTPYAKGIKDLIWQPPRIG